MYFQKSKVRCKRKSFDVRALFPECQMKYSLFPKCQVPVKLRKIEQRKFKHVLENIFKLDLKMQTIPLITP